MQDQQKLFDTIEKIYAASGHSSGWQNAISAITELVNGKASAYLLVNSETLNNEITAICGFSDRDMEAYQGPNGAAKDVRFQYLHNLIPGKVFREFEYVTDKNAWDESEWIQYQQEHLGCYYCMSAKVSTHGLWHDYISINRLEKLGQHTDQEKHQLQLLLPHLSRAAELHRTISRLEHQYGAVLSVLDHLLVGLVIIDSQQRIVVKNTAAREICENTGLLRMAQDSTLRAVDPQHNVKLQQLISNTLATTQKHGLSEGGQLALDKNERMLLLESMPLLDESFPDGDNIRGIGLFMIDPSLSAVVSLEGISNIFGLTPSESEVASALVNGLSVQEISEQRDSTTDTIRKHLKSTYSKTGANSQLDLLRLAIKANPPIRNKT